MHDAAALPWLRLGWASAWRVSALLVALILVPALFVSWLAMVLAGPAYAVATMGVAVLGAGSVLAHEVGHLLALRLVRPAVSRTQVVVVGTWLSASVQRPRLTAVAERRVAAAGPVGGTLVGLPLLLVPVPIGLRAVLLVPFCLHLLSLLPCFPDGRNFWRAHA